MLNKILDLIFAVAPEFVLRSVLLLNLALVAVVLIIAAAYLAICYLIGGAVGAMIGGFLAVLLLARGDEGNLQDYLDGCTRR